MVDAEYRAIFWLIMNDQHQENRTLSGPLILTLPVSNFVAIVRPDWLNRNRPDSRRPPVRSEEKETQLHGGLSIGHSYHCGKN